MKRALLLGGTGAMGKYLAKELVGKGYKVFITSRTTRTSTENIDFLLGNAQCDTFLRGLLKEHWDVIVDFMVYKSTAFKKRIGWLLDGTDQYVFLSSARVYAESDKPLTESSPRLLDVINDNEYLRTDEYALSKARQEDMLISSGKVHWTIVRPYITYSDERLQLGPLELENWLYRAMRGRTVPFSDLIFGKRTTMSDGQDVARGIASLTGNIKAFAKTVHLTNNASLLWCEVIELYRSSLREAVGRDLKIRLIDNNKFIRIFPSKYQILYDRNFNRQFDNKMAEQFFDVSSFTAPYQGLAIAINNFLEKPKFRDVNWRVEALMDRVVDERTPMSQITGVKNKLRYLKYRYLQC